MYIIILLFRRYKEEMVCRDGTNLYTIDRSFSHASTSKNVVNILSYSISGAITSLASSLAPSSISLPLDRGESTASITRSNLPTASSHT